MSTSFAPTVLELVDRISDLPTQPTAALRVLDVLDDPDAAAVDLAGVIETDLALSARVMHLANSPYYGQARQVSSALRAVTVLGFGTVRALAAIAAAGLFDDDAQAPPAFFWPHSTATAAAAALVARRTGHPASEAFSAGLLHDLGVALLDRYAPTTYRAAILEPADSPEALADREREAVGATHTEAAAAVLEAWQFPVSFVNAVRDHHEDGDISPLAAVVAAGESLAARVGAAGIEQPEPIEISFARCGLELDLVDDLVEAATRETDAVAGMFAP